MKPDVTLIFPKSEFLLDQAVFPPLGILYLSAYLKACGLNVQCLDMGLGHTPDMAESDIVGISITTPQRISAFELCQYFRRQGRYVIAGGPHPTHMPKECLENGFNRVIPGYGEKELANVLSAYGDNGMDVFPDRSALPMRSYHYEIDGRPATPIMTSRGCPFHCAFCGRITGEFVMQSAERTVAEIEHIHNQHGYDAFMIFDDVFVSSKNRLKKLADMIGGKYIFRCFARSNLLDDSVCHLLKKLGVVEVGIGVESGSSDILEKNMKGTNRKMNTRAVRRLHNYGIRAKAFLIVGLPGETPETVMETADWIEEAEPDDIDVSVLQPMPGSAIFQDPKKWGIHYSYNGRPGWYKGIPGQYQAVATDALTAEDVVQWRDLLEMQYKPKELLR